MAQQEQLSQPQVAPAPIPGTKATDNAPIGAFGGGAATGEAFGSITDMANTAADVLYKQAQRKKELSDLNVNYGLATQVSQLQNSLLYDPQTGATYQHGQNADGIHDRTMDAWQKGISDIGQGISDPRQQMAFQEQVKSHQVELDRILRKHEGDEQLATTASTITSAAANFSDAAEKAALTDPASTQLNLQRSRASLNQLADLKGLSGTSREQFVNSQMSASHTRILTALIDGQQDLKAEQYFKDHKQDFYGNDYTKALQATQKSSILGESYRRMDLILTPKETTIDSEEGGETKTTIATQQEAMAQVAKIDNPRVRQMTTELMKAHFAEKLQAEHQDIAEAFMEASRQMNQPDNVAALRNGQPLETILPPSLLDRVSASPEHLNALRAMGIDRQVSEPDAVIQMSRLVSDKATLGKMDISDVMKNVGGRLNSSDRAGLRKAWDDAHEADLKNAATPVPTAEIDRAVNDALVNWKVPGWRLYGQQPFEKGMQKLSGEAKDRAVAFREEVYRLAQSEKSTKGRPLGPDEIQNVVDKALGRQVDVQKTNPVSNFLFGSERLPYGMMLPGEKIWQGSRMGGQVESIPDKDRQTMVGLMNEMKGSKLDWKAVPGDDSRLQRMWLAFKTGNKDLMTHIASE